MIADEQTVIEELLVHDEDFPPNYVDMAHPDDYKLTHEKICQFIMHKRFGRHNRLIARVPWKVQKEKYVYISFICDTGAPSHFYLSKKKALTTLSDHNILQNDERNNLYVKVHKHKRYNQ